MVIVHVALAVSVVTFLVVSSPEAWIAFLALVEMLDWPVALVAREHVEYDAVAAAVAAEGEAGEIEETEGECDVESAGIGEERWEEG